MNERRRADEGRTLAFSLPLPPRELNPNERLPRVARAGAARVYAEEVGYELYFQLGHAAPTFRRARLVIAIPPSRQGWDFDNLLAAFKPGLDRIVGFGLLEDDAPAYLTEITIRRYQGRGQQAGRMEVQLIEVC